MRLLKRNQYGNSEVVEKNILDYLRNECHEKRRASRLKSNLPDNVHSVDENLHQSKLVTMASFDLKNKKRQELLDLLNNHGVEKFSIEP